jgi:CheY-specific phosphatase CheX/anti-anti-sigma regulatory factor
MKPTVKKQTVAIFSLQGFIDGQNANSFITLQDMQFVEAKNFEMVLISFKKVISFNKNGIAFFEKILKDFHKKIGCQIGICDLTKKQYDQIKHFFKNDVPFSLFDTEEHALIFRKEGTAKQNNNSVLVWKSDSSQRSMIAIELFDRGYNPVVAQTYDDYVRLKANKDKYIAILDKLHIGIKNNMIAAQKVKNTVIYYLKDYLDGDILEQFDIKYHQNCLKIGFKTFMFNATRVASFNIHASNFFFKLSAEGAEYGALFAFVGLETDKIPKSFIQELQDAGYLFFDTEKEFYENEDVKATEKEAMAGKTGKKLSKQLVSHIADFTEATVHTLQIMTSTVPKRQDVKLQKLTIKDDAKDYLASSIAIYGELEGMISIVMEKSLTRKACELLLGDVSDEEMLLDGLSEIVNVITGKAKSILSDKNININITIPRNFESLRDLQTVLGEKKGVQIDFTFQDQPFTFFLSS